MYDIQHIKAFQQSFLSVNLSTETKLSWLAFSIGNESFLLPAHDIFFISPYRNVQELYFLENCYSGYAHFDGRFYSVADLSAFFDNIKKVYKSNYLIYLKDSSLALMAQVIQSFSINNIDDGGESKFPFCENQSLYLGEDGIEVANLINSQKIKELI